MPPPEEIVEEVRHIEAVVSHEFEHRSVKAVASGLADQADDAAPLAIFGREHISIYLEFLDGID